MYDQGVLTSLESISTLIEISKKNPNSNVYEKARYISIYFNNFLNTYINFIVI